MSLYSSFSDSSLVRGSNSQFAPGLFSKVGGVSGCTGSIDNVKAANSSPGYEFVKKGGSKKLKHRGGSKSAPLGLYTNYPVASDILQAPNGGVLNNVKGTPLQIGGNKPNYVVDKCQVPALGNSVVAPGMGTNTSFVPYAGAYVQNGGKRKTNKRKQRRRKSRKNRKGKKRGGSWQKPSLSETGGEETLEALPPTQEQLKDYQRDHGTANMVRSMFGMKPKKKAPQVHPLGGGSRKMRGGDNRAVPSNYADGVPYYGFKNVDVTTAQQLAPGHAPVEVAMNTTCTSPSDSMQGGGKRRTRKYRKRRPSGKSLKKKRKNRRKSHKKRKGKKRQRKSKKQRGGYHQFLSNTPYSASYSIAGNNISSSELALANPPPYSRFINCPQK